MFEYNDCNVCINPKIVFHAMKKGVLAWDFVEIKICEYYGKWDFGYWHGGGASPAMKTCAKFNSENECVDAAINKLENLLKKGNSMSKNNAYYLNELIAFKVSRMQMSLF